MSPKEAYVVRLMFRVQVHEKNGTEFESLFIRVMQHANPNFSPVKPQGRIGDRKNDGFDKKAGDYYQVFAPEDPSQKAGAAAKKLSEDFQGLLEYWDDKYPIKTYSFVFNDKFHGAFPEVHAAIAELEKTHPDRGFSLFLAKDLLDVFLTLDESLIPDVLGGFPPSAAELDPLDYSIASQVVSQLVARGTASTFEGLLVAPDFFEKIKFNGLSETPASLLRVASYQAGDFKEVLSSLGEMTEEHLRVEVATEYERAKSEYQGDADQVFFALLSRFSGNRSKPHQDAATVMMAYYLEACDIFEPLPTESA